MRRFGIEHTLLPKYHDIGWYDENKKDEYQWYISKKVELLLKITDIHSSVYRTKENIYSDPGVIEWISPILSSFEEAKIWFHKVQEYADVIDFTSFREDVCLGGGHIHISVPLEIDRMKIANYAKLYPFLFWSTLSSEDEYNGKVKVELFPIKILNSFYCRVNSIEPRNDYKTIEWRAFDSAATWDIQYLQLQLAHRMVDKLLNEKTLRRSNLLKQIQKVHVECRSLDYCIISFRNLILELGLKNEDYDWMIERNLKPRFDNEEFISTKY